VFQRRAAACINAVLLAGVFLPAIEASCGEVAATAITASAPERFHLAFRVSGEGQALLRAGGGSVAFSSRKAPGASLSLVVPGSGAAVDCYSGAGRLDVFLDNRYAGGVALSAHGGFPVEIEAAGDVRVEALRFASLHHVYFRDDFMRVGSEGGVWKYSGARLKVVSELRPDKSASPFRLECPGPEGSIRAGNVLWRDYCAAAAFAFGAEGGSVMLGTHLRGDYGLWAELSSDGRFVVRQGEPGTGRLLAALQMPALPSQWHEIALGSGSAAVNGVEIPLKDLAPLPGGKTAITLSGSGTSVDDVRIESSRAPLGAFLRAFWMEPGAVADFFQREDKMAEWSRGRFLWELHGNASASLKPPVFGDRGVVFGSWKERSTRLRVNLAEGASATIALSDDKVVIDASIGGRSAQKVLSRRDDAAVWARGNAVCVGAEAVVASEDASEPSGPLQVELLEGKWPDVIRPVGANMRDITFSRAPAGFVPVSGEWKVSSRWRCSPELTWYAGAGDPAHAVYRHTLEGDGAVALSFAHGMTARNAPFYNWPMGMVIALSPDPIDPFAGVAFVAQGLTGPSALYVAGEKAAEDASLFTQSSDAARMQETFSRIHHRWEVVRMERRGSRIAVTQDGGKPVAAENAVVRSGVFLHVLCPAKSLAVLSRLHVSFEKTGDAPAGAWDSLVAGQAAASVSVNGNPAVLVPPPSDGRWAFAFSPVGGPDAVDGLPGGGVKFTMLRPGRRWAAGVGFSKPRRIRAVAFRVRGGRNMRAALILDTEIGPVRTAFYEEAPLAPCHELPPALPAADGSVNYDFSDAWRALGVSPLVRGIYFGELDRFPDDGYGLKSSRPGRSIEVGPLELEFDDEAPAAPDASTAFLAAPLEVLNAHKIVCAVEAPGVELARLGTPSGAAALGQGVALGWTDGASLVKRIGVSGNGFFAINPRMGGPAGTWLHRGDAAVRRVPFAALKAGWVDGYPHLAWDVIVGTPNGKVSLHWNDNNRRFASPGKAVPLHGALAGWMLFDLRLAAGNASLLNGIALADAVWYTSCEYSAARLDGFSWGVMLNPDERIRVSGFGGPVAFAVYDFSGKLLEEGVAQDGAARPSAVGPASGRCVLVLKHRGVERLVPLLLERNPDASSRPLAWSSRSAHAPAAVLISDGEVSTFFDDPAAFTPLVRNRRGAFPAVDAPPGWSETAARELDRLPGGLLVEMLDKPHEGYYLLAQDSGWAGREKVIRAAVALPSGVRGYIAFSGRGYWDISRVNLPRGDGGPAHIQAHLNKDVDSAYIVTQDQPFLVRAVSVSAPDERRMRLRFFNIPPGAVCGWTLKRRGGEPERSGWAPEGEHEIRFAVEGPPGVFLVTPIIAAGADRQELPEIEVTVK